MRKRISFCILLVFICLFFSSCRSRNVLLFLNWGEYIDEDVISEFEKKYNCEVVMDLGDSNELFYSKLSAGTTIYDVMCPSDYMVLKMTQNDMLRELDFSLISNYNRDDLMEGVKGIRDELEQMKKGISNYYVPYLWGTWGIVYSTKKEGLKDIILNSSNEWEALFNRDVLPKGTTVAMYDSNQHAYYAACKYLGFDTDKELASDELDLIYEAVKNMDYDTWGTDDIKKDIVAGNRDLGFMWTGDFLYYYCDRVASSVIDAYLNGDASLSEIEEMIATITNNSGVYKNKYQVGFDIFIPKDTIAFCDNFVIPKNSSNYELAHKFIDFMCGRAIDTTVDPALNNTLYVSYNTPFKALYDDIVEYKNIKIGKNDLDNINSSNAYSSLLYEKAYNIAIGIAFEKYYPKEEEIELDGIVKKYKGNILATFKRTYINMINNTFNNAKA